MLELLRTYLKAPVFPGDDDKTFTASLLHVILWSLLVGVSLYTLTASVFAIIQPHMLLTAWLYVIAIGALAVTLLVVMRRGYVRFAAITVNVGFGIILTVAAYFNGGVAAPAYSGYLIAIICTCLLVSWQWGVIAAAASTAAGLLFLRVELPPWAATYSVAAVWGANVAYFFAAVMLLALALRAIKHAAQQAHHAVVERQQTEQALSHSEQRFRAIFDAVNDAIFVHDLNTGGILEVNQKMCEMYGYTAEEARQLTVEDLSAGVPLHTQQEALARLQQAAGGAPQVFEWLAKDRADRQFWVEVNMRRAAIDGQDRVLVVVRDIDERKRAEAALRREQAYYQAIVNATPVMLWLKDTENRTVHLNPAAVKFEGVEAAAVEGKSAYDVYPREQAEAYYQDDVEVMQSGQPRLGIVEQHTAPGTGKVMWVETGKVPVRDEAGRIVGVLACAVDITERKAAEERERRISQGLRAVIEATQELIDCADLDTLYRRAVELAREKLGAERCGLFLLDEQAQYLIGTYGTDDQGGTTDEHQARALVSPAQHSELFVARDCLWTVHEIPLTYWADSAARVIPEPGWMAATPIRSLRRNIGVLYNDTAVTRAPLDEAQQDLIAVYASLLGGLLELKRADSALAHERDLLQSLMDNIPDAIYFKDTASRFTAINPAMAHILGLSAPHEAQGKTDADFFSTDLDELYLVEEQQLLRTGQPVLDRVEYNPAPNGQPRWLSATKVPLRDSAGQIVGLVGISRNITDRMLAEQREKTIGQGLRAIIEAAQELIDCADLDAMYRRAVELAREKLGLKRCGLFVLDEHATYLRGTYGTDDQGHTVDEHQARDPISPERHRELFATPDRLWTVYERPLAYWQTDAIVHLPQPGWNVGTVIRSRHRTIGILYNDAGLTQAPLDETQQDLTAVYASLLGSLLDLKHAETELAHERDLLQVLMDNFPDTIYFKDTASRFTRINRAQARMLGIATPEEAMGKTDADFFHAAELNQMFLAEEQQLMRRGEPIVDRVEYNPTADGQPRWLSATKVPLRDATGSIVGMVGISRDITDRRLLEERERRTSQGLRAVIEMADDLIACADLDLLYRRAVELARTKLGLERCGLFMLDEQGWLHGTYGTDLQRQTTDERGAYFPPPNPEDFAATSDRLWAVNEAEQAYWRAQQQESVGKGWVATTFIRTRDRVMGVMYNDTAISHAPVDEAQQEVLAVYSSLLGSLTELKRAEEATRESETLYRRAIEAVGAVPYYLDYASEAYRSMGDGIQAMTGLPPGEMQPADWDPLIQEAYPLGQTRGLAWGEAVQETRAGHVSEWRCDYRIRRPDGVERWITDASIQVLDEQGQPRGAIGILQDISDRKQVELALRESEATTRALLDAIPDAIFRFDAGGIFKEYIPSRDFAALLPSDEFLGKSYTAVMPPVIVEQLDLNFQQVLAQGGLRSYEYPLLIGDELRYFEARLVKMTQGDVLGMVRDVTDRKRAELALQQREAYLRSIFDNFPYWIWLKDTHGRYLAANHTLAQALGLAQAEDLIGKTDWDVTPTVAASFVADDRAVMESRIQKLIEEIVIDHGEEKWFETFKSPIFDAHGQVIGTAGFAHDITARRQAEAAMRESEALFRQLADNAPALIALRDVTGQETYLNRAWREFCGAPPDVPLEKWAERIHPDDRHRYAHEFRSALQGQRKHTAEYRLRRADGQYRWLLDTAVPRYAADERFAGFIGIAIDITDRKNAEEALRRSEGRLRLITDNMADSVSQVDAQQRLIYASPSAERVYGHAVGDLLGRSLYEDVHPEDSARIYHQVVMAAELRTGSLRLEYRYRHAAGQYFWVESEMRLLYDERGGFAGAVLGSRDISARKQIETEREKLIKELEDKNAELERFTYTVSHDLKSPLITIRGFLGFLEKDATSGNLDRLRADVARIAEATTRMQRLLDELLELSRIGRMTNPPEAVAFDQVAREAVELVQGRIMARGVQVTILPNLPVVYADHTRLVEAVQNLVDNAAKFMGDQPEPRITIGALGDERAGMPIFFVEDNGVGIEPQYHERVFGLFNKLDVKSEGTGVGLALVKRIIDLHGGYIWVESDGAGHGSTFFFTLPRPAAAASA